MGCRICLCDADGDEAEGAEAANGLARDGAGVGGEAENAGAADGLTRGGSGALVAADALIRSLSISAVRNRLCLSFMRAAGDCGPMKKDMNRYSQLSARLERSALQTFSEHSRHVNHRDFPLAPLTMTDTLLDITCSHGMVGCENVTNA